MPQAPQHPDDQEAQAMTIETGAKRDHYGETSDAARRAFTSYRQPDAVRAAALANAVDLVARVGAEPGEDDDLAGYTLDLARTFEAYLTGEEAHGTPNP
jgi:hypothetical protein